MKNKVKSKYKQLKSIENNYANLMHSLKRIDRLAESMNTLEKLHNSIDFQNSIYYYNGPTANVNLIDFVDTSIPSDKKKPNRTKLADEEIAR